MATLAREPLVPPLGDERFFLRAAILITLIIFAGFSTQLAMGRSSFGSPLRVHIHAWLFMGWVVLYLLQNVLVATGRTHLHRRLGWIGAAWIVPMVVMGFVVTVAVVRNGTTPFFFRPLQFLVFDPLTVLGFAGLSGAAIVMRRRTEWHRRLHFCGMSLLLAPAFGRLLPLPLLQPWAWEVCFAVSLLFPIAGAWADVRRSGRAHPAWRWGIAASLAVLVLTEAITYSPPGTALYRAATAGSPGAAVAPLDFGVPAGRLITGR